MNTSIRPGTISPVKERRKAFIFRAFRRFFVLSVAVTKIGKEGTWASFSHEATQMLKNKGLAGLETGHKNQEWKRILQEVLLLENEGFVGMMSQEKAMGKLVTEMVS